MRIAVSYVRDRMAAEDIVTDSFVAYWENHTTTEIRSVPAYILTAVKNRCLNWLETYPKSNITYTRLPIVLLYRAWHRVKPTSRSRCL